VSYRFGAGRYEITVRNPLGVNRGVGRITLDGRPLEGHTLPLDAAQGQHEVEVVLGPPEPAA
jgi:cyclic beta-1,2-glucan synthetase